jgi:hypothetical protein
MLPFVTITWCLAHGAGRLGNLPACAYVAKCAGASPRPALYLVSRHKEMEDNTEDKNEIPNPKRVSN